MARFSTKPEQCNSIAIINSAKQAKTIRNKNIQSIVVGNHNSSAGITSATLTTTQ
jgi:hypothetical protein